MAKRNRPTQVSNTSGRNPDMSSGTSLMPYDLSHYDALFKDTDYWDLYQSIVNQYSTLPPTTWFGNITGKNAENEYNHRQNFFNALSNLADSMRVQEYNEPVNQVQREKEAGLNPDLQGLSGEGLAQPSQQPEPNKLSVENPIPHILSFAQLVGSAALNAQSMVSQDLVNEGMKLQNLDLAKGIVLKSLSNIDPNEQGDIMPSLRQSYPGLSRRQSKKLNDLASVLYGSVEHELSWRKGKHNIASERKSLFDITSSAGYNPDDEVMSETAVFLADQRLLVTKAEEAQKLSASKRDKVMSDIMTEVFTSERGYIANLRQRASKGEKRATRLLLELLGQNVTFDDEQFANWSGGLSNVIKSPASWFRKSKK